MFLLEFPIGISVNSHIFPWNPMGFPRVFLWSSYGFSHPQGVPIQQWTTRGQAVTNSENTVFAAKRLSDEGSSHRGIFLDGFELIKDVKVKI